MSTLSSSDNLWPTKWFTIEEYCFLSSHSSFIWTYHLRKALFSTIILLPKSCDTFTFLSYRILPQFFILYTCVCVCVLTQKKEIKRKFSWHLDHRWAIRSDNWTSMAQDHAQIGLDGSICYLLGVYDDDENWDAFSWHIYWVFFFLQGTSWTSFFEAHDLFLQHDILCDYYCHWFLIIFFSFWYIAM